MFYVDFDQHDISIIEVDGVEVEPYPIGIVSISIGQRYSILLTAKEGTAAQQNYALSVVQSADMYDYLPKDLILANTLQIVYNEGSAPAKPVDLGLNEDDGDMPMLDDTIFTPLVKMEMVGVDVDIRLDAYFDVSNSVVVDGERWLLWC